MTLEITPKEAMQFLAQKKAIILDVRTKPEIDAAHLNDFVWIPLQELEARIEEVQALPQDKKILTLCHHGHRSLIATRILANYNITSQSIHGGIKAWAHEVDHSVPEYVRLPNSTVQIIKK